MSVTGFESILDFSRPLDVALLDRAVGVMFEGGAPPAVQGLLVQFQEDPRTWALVDRIVQQSARVETKMIALSALLSCVKYRWRVLSPENQAGIKAFLMTNVIALSKDAASLRTMHPLVTRFNMVLVEVLKHEWPRSWPEFLPDLVQSCSASESVCTNNMNILRLLSEEIFDYSGGQMTQEKIREMKQSLNAEFELVFRLCEYVLGNSQNPVLLSATLRAMERFLSWIPVGFIFETQLIETLALKFFPADLFQNQALRCLAEVAALKLPDHPEYDTKFLQLFFSVTRHVASLMTDDTDVAVVYATGDPKVQDFVRFLTLFLSGFLRSHLETVESVQGPLQQEAHQILFASFRFLMRMTRVDDVDVFNICLEYWNSFVADLYRSQRQQTPRPVVLGRAVGSMRPTGGVVLSAAGTGGTNSNPFGAGIGVGAGAGAGGLLGAVAAASAAVGGAGAGPGGGGGATVSRVAFYDQVLRDLRLVMISKMAKPEEVLIVENENGEFVREVLKESGNVVLYKSIRECLIYLTHLDAANMQDTLLMKLQRQMDGSEWSHQNLNVLCWAIGSISGALQDTQEKQFLVRVIKDLLNLCEQKRIKTHKAVIASNIMYVVGQYPRFLRMHWKFLRTVIVKLFEFMHEPHPGVQDMSCETFVKISSKCAKKFVQLQDGEQRPFIYDILDRMPATIRDLPEHNQVLLFYTALGHIVHEESEPEARQELIYRVMEMPNQAWAQITLEAGRLRDSVLEPATVRRVAYVLKVNNAVAAAVGPGYLVQFSRIFLEMLGLYKIYSESVSSVVAAQGERMAGATAVRQMRQVKKEVLNLARCFVRVSQDADTPVVLKDFLPNLLPPVLEDYAAGAPAARDPEVLRLVTEVVERYGEAVQVYMPKVLESCFASTLSMITHNFSDNPEHRVHFFAMLRAINHRLFGTLLQMTAAQFKLIVDSVVWAFRHLDHEIADTGLDVLLELLQNFQKQQSDVANHFFQAHLLSLLSDILGVMTDTLHMSGFQLHATILARIFQIVDTGTITAPLWDLSAGPQFPNNQTCVRQVTLDMLTKSFPNMSPEQVGRFVAGLFELHSDIPSFKSLLRDFLVQCKEFAAADPSGLFSEEQRLLKARQAEEESRRLAEVPGLAYTGGNQFRGDDNAQDDITD